MSDNEEQPVVGDAPPSARVWFSNRTYDRLKFLAQVLLPGLGTLYFSLSGIWGDSIFPEPDKVSGTVLAVDTLLGLILAAGTRQYKNNDDRFDGHILLEDLPEEGMTNVNLQMDPAALGNSKGEVTLKVKNKGEVQEF